LQSAQKVAEGNSILIHYKSIKKSVKKYSSQKEKYLTLLGSDSLRHKETSRSHHLPLHRLLKNRSKEKINRQRKNNNKYPNGSWKVQLFGQG